MSDSQAIITAVSSLITALLTIISIAMRGIMKQQEDQMKYMRETRDRDADVISSQIAQLADKDKKIASMKSSLRRAISELERIKPGSSTNYDTGVFD